MNPDEIRATAIERVARAAYTRFLDVTDAIIDAKGITVSPELLTRIPWDELDDDSRAVHLAAATHAVDALGDMLPTGEGWGVVAPGNAWLVDYRTRQEAQDEAHRWEDGRVQHAWTHEPTEVTD